MTLREEKIAWVIREFLVGGSFCTLTEKHLCPGIETALGGDDACDRAGRFGEAFPGRKPDSLNGTENDNARLRRVMNQMRSVGAMERNRVGIYCDYLGDHPGWCYVWRMSEDLYNQIKRGEMSVEFAARDIAKAI